MRQKRILVVDDELFIAHILEFCLAMEGYDVVATGRGEEVSQLIAGLPLDLAIIDFTLPDTCGLDLARELVANERLREIPIILLTTDSDEIDMKEVGRAGVRTIVTKPINTPELIKTISVLFDASPIEEDEFAETG